jgi:hypothetical protein
MEKLTEEEKALLIKSREEELETLVKIEYENYCTNHNIGIDGLVDYKDFAKEAENSIESIYGEDKFDDFNIQSYAKWWAVSQEDF